MNKTETSHKNQKKQISSRLTGIFLVMLALVLVSTFAFFYLQKISQREKLAGLLPADRTVALLEFNMEPGRQDARQTLDLLLQNQSINQFSSFVQSLIPFREQFEKWFSGRGGFAMLTTPDAQDLRAAIFLGVKDPVAAEAWIESLLLDPNGDALLDEDYYGQKLISFKKGQSMQILWTKEFLVLSEDKEILQAVAQTVAGSLTSLREIPSYNQLSSALPEQNLGFGYLDRGRLLQTLARNEQFLSGRLALFKLYFPLINLVGTEGVALRLSTGPGGQPVLIARHLSLFRPSALSDRTLFETGYFYDGKLEKYAPSDSLFLVGGSNLLAQKNKLQNYLAGGSSLDQLLMAGLQGALQDALSSQSQKANLDSDFFPLFQKNYLFTLNPVKGGIPGFGLFIESAQPENDLLKLKKIVLNFAPKLAAEFLAKPTPMTLPDGTVGSEMKAEISDPSRKEIMIEGQRVDQLEFSPNFSIYLLADAEKQLLLATDSLTTVKNILEKSPAAQQQSADYGLEKPTEVYFLDMESLIRFMPELKGLSPLKYLKVARKFSEIGILSTYQIGF